ncbi:MAG: hypothetical protein ACLTW9_15630 [Enterocloster sp.]
MAAEQTVSLSASVGESLRKQRFHGETIDALLQRSDQALYQAKEGRPVQILRIQIKGD